MKVLEYTERNLKKISETKKVPLDQVRKDFLKSQLLGMKIYSTVDYIFWNTGKIGPEVTFVSSHVIENHFDILEGSPREYRVAIPKKRD